MGLTSFAAKFWRWRRSAPQARAETVLTELRKLIPEADLPRIVAYGEALPIACDETAAGRRLNRRVELWLKPNFAPSP